MSHAVRKLPALRRPVRTAKPCRKLEPRLDCLEDRNLLAVIAVTNTGDAGVGTLRAAIAQANAQMGADEIQFGILAGTISLTSAELLITGDLTIEGPGADTL